MATHRFKAAIRHGLFFTLSLSSLVVTGAAVTSAFAQSSQTVTITAHRIPVPVDQTGSSVTIFTEEDIERRQSALVSDVLRTAPGMAINRAGSQGQLTQARMRGAEGNHTLVLIDGVEANDPFNSAEFNFADLLATDIEHIEVLRGPQSALYGSEAIGGVISITSKAGKPGFETNGFIETGSFSTWRGNFGVSGGEENWRGALNASGFATQGTNISRFGSEEDEYSNTSFSGRGVFDILPNASVGGSLRITQSETQNDNGDFAFPPTPTSGLIIDTDEVRKSQFIYGSLWGKASLFDDLWTHKLSATITNGRNKRFSANAFTDKNNSQKNHFSYQTDVGFNLPEILESAHGLSFVVEREKTSFYTQGTTAASPQTQNRSIVQTSVSGEYRLSLLDRLFLSGSLRCDNNEFFNDQTTYRISGSLKFDETGTRFHGTQGTGVTAPNLFELFGFTPGEFMGNASLKQETSKGFDFGVEQRFFDDKLIFDVTYFKSSLQDEINTVFLSFFPPLSTVTNLTGRSNRQGVEVSMTAFALDNLDIRGSYTYLEAKQPGDITEVRRPRHTASLNANLRAFKDRANFNLDVTYTGNQQDFAFSPFFPPIVELDAYTLVSLAASYEISEGVKLTARAENLLDQEYEEVFSYRGSGAAAYLGVSFEFGN